MVRPGADQAGPAASAASAAKSCSTVPGARILPWPEGCCYGVAKAGLALMAKAMAQELAEHGIRVNIVAPGIILAGLSKICYETDPNYAPRATTAIPLREFGTPEQCADAFLFLGQRRIGLHYGRFVAGRRRGQLAEERLKVSSLPLGEGQGVRASWT